MKEWFYEMMPISLGSYKSDKLNQICKCCGNNIIPDRGMIRTGIVVPAMSPEHAIGILEALQDNIYLLKGHKINPENLKRY